MRLAIDANIGDFAQTYRLAQVRYRRLMIGAIAVFLSRQSIH